MDSQSVCVLGQLKLLYFFIYKANNCENNAQIVRLYRHTKLNQDNKIALFNWLCLRKEKDLNIHCNLMFML